MLRVISRGVMAAVEAGLIKPKKDGIWSDEGRLCVPSELPG